MTTCKKRFAVLTAVSLLSASLPAAEYVKNGDFENGEVAPWRLSKPNEKITLSVVPDSGSPDGYGALGVTLPGDDRRIDLKQNVKIGPGTYKFTAYMDTTRCTKPGGYIMLYLSGTVDGKWHNFGGVSTPGTAKGGWKKTEWRKYEKIITVPAGGSIRSINIALANHLTGTVMVDGISVQECPAEAAEKPADSAQ